IFARYPSYIHVVHDRNTPNLVYGYIDFKPLLELKRSAKTEALKRQIEKAILKELKEKLAETMGVKAVSVSTEIERQHIRNLLRPYAPKTVSDTATLLSNIRTQTGQSDIFHLALYRSRELLPEAESIFKYYQLPRGLTRIPFVESSFNNRARSKVGAFGVW